MKGVPMVQERIVRTINPDTGEISEHIETIETVSQSQTTHSRFVMINKDYLGYLATLPGNALKVYMIMLAIEHNNVFAVSAQTISDLTQLSRASVYRAIKTLKDSGLIKDIDGYHTAMNSDITWSSRNNKSKSEYYEVLPESVTPIPTATSGYITHNLHNRDVKKLNRKLDRERRERESVEE